MATKPALMKVLKGTVYKGRKSFHHEMAGKNAFHMLVNQGEIGRNPSCLTQ